ncbi:FGGY carbohydrate kinase domain-containing protein [Termitomyces sp. J132]|nr:FGGY carbohydrate kinase domain-containing protein [Termitomyces sp. J132]
MSLETYYIGIDVGTGSVRASLVKKDGSVVASSIHDTITYRDPNDHRIFEQSTTNIWSNICAAVKDCLSSSNTSPSAVKGLGFDATCSLAVSDFQGEPIIVTKGERLGQYGDRNVVLWADHRAEKEADLINSTESIVLDYVGGVMSLEMEIPKILWLKNHMDPTLFSRCQFFDLPDFLTYRATSNVTRSCCSLTCKCSYVPKSEELGLIEGTPVGSGLIDAYAGWLGTVAARYKEDGILSEIIPSLDTSQHRLAAVAGTSTCHLVQVCQSPKGVFVNGVWGPYKDAVFQGWWMNEGGQSSTGQLIDFILTTHPAYTKLVELAKVQEKNIHTVLQEILEELRIERNVDTLTELTKDLHIYPDFHGNRSPIADPRMRGSFVGLELDDGLNDLARKYNVTLEAIALQTRHIIDEMNAKGHDISTIYMSGGQAKNIPLMKLFADICGMPVVLPFEHSAAVVLGAAMLGRFAAEFSERSVQEEKEEGEESGTYIAPCDLSGQQQGDLLWKIMVEMTPVGTLVVPSASAREKKLLETKYKIFRESIEIQKRWRKEMDEASK